MTEIFKNGLANDSTLCRLCAQVNQNGSNIFSEEVEPNLRTLINKYLPLKVENDGKYPDKICPGCEIQLEATKLFFDLIMEGQNQLKSLYDVKSDIVQLQDLQNMSSKPGTLEVHSIETGEKYIIQIMPNILPDGPLYTADHEMSNSMNVLQKEKKKRGRPRKQQIDNTAEPKKTVEEKSIHETVEDGKRQRKVPARFSETVQGKELDDILRKEGIDEEEIGSENLGKSGTEIIGRVEDQNGVNLDEEIIVSKVLNGKRIKSSAIPKRKRRRKYTCEHCLEEFRNHTRLRMHMKKMHNDAQPNQKIGETSETMIPQTDTEKNGNEENSAPNLLDTLLKSGIEGETAQETSQDPTNFTCGVCSDIFRTEKDLTEHLEGDHQNGKQFHCSQCSRSFSFAKTFQIHMERHKKGLLFCEVCQKKFNRISSLVYHRNAEHNGKRFVCNKCNKSFKHRQLLKRHQLVHTEERPHKCSICSAAFKTKTNLISHNSIHTGERNYICSECGQCFAHKTSLNLHTRWHLGEKPFPCDICKKSFSQKGNLVEHMRIHTGEKPFCCEICGRNFTTSSQLKLHRKRHTGDRPWKCDFCARTFLHKDSWTEHCRRHMNERPFKCELCSKTFTTRHCLRKHTRLHTGEKPHSCEICLKDFSDLSNLAKHKRVHEAKANDNENMSLLNTDPNNLLYVYYEAAKNDNIDVPIVDLGQAQADVIDDPDVLNFKGDCMQIKQLIDQEGNPLSLNTQDGQQINVVTSITNGEEKLQGLLPDGTLIALDLQDSKDENMKSLVDQVEEQASVSHLLLDGNMTFLSGDIEKTGGDLLVSDPSNICFVTYDPNTQSIP